MDYNEDLEFMQRTVRVLLGTAEAATPALADIKTFVNGDSSATPAVDPYETPPTGFVDLGNTSMNNVVAFEQDDATTETRGSAQNKKQREIETAPAVERFTVNSLQPKDGDVLKMYYGGGTVATGSFSAPRSSDTAETVKSALLVFIDGSEVYPAYCPKVSIARNGVVSFPVDDYAEVPLKGTILDPSSGSPTIWLSDDITTT